MFNFYSLYSGSSGNSLLVESENTKVLIDAGVSSKKIETALTGLNIDPSSIDGISERGEEGVRFTLESERNGLSETGMESFMRNSLWRDKKL